MSARQWGVPEVVSIAVAHRGPGRPRKMAGDPIGHYRSNPERAERSKRIVSMFNEGKTLDHIGREFNLTRERIRQICNRLGCKPRQKQAAERAAGRKAAERFRVDFARSMKRHLWAAGFRRCFQCKIWQPYNGNSKQPGHICRKCNSDRIFRYNGSRHPELRGISQSERISRLWAMGSLDGKVGHGLKAFWAKMTPEQRRERGKYLAECRAKAAGRIS